MTKPVVILVAPQMGENIGAAARIMKNFGINELRIVRPRDGWPNEKAESMAVGAIDVIKNAKIYDNLEEAIADLEYLYATTATPRQMNKDYVSSRSLGEDYAGGLKVGVMFGRENCGLNNQEITLANKIITIATSDFSSLNIAQAIAIVCYELFCNQNRVSLNSQERLATHEELGYFFEHLFVELDKANFFKIPEKRPQMVKNIMNIFTRIDKLSKNELQALRGVIRGLSGNNQTDKQ
jgi:tRNA/rRNA methyltransferase